MKGTGIIRWLSWVLAVALLSGCSGILLESKNDNGQVERLMLDRSESWDSYDDRPRNPFANSKKHGMDDMGLMLKSQTSF